MSKMLNVEVQLVSKMPGSLIPTRAKKHAEQALTPGRMTPARYRFDATVAYHANYASTNNGPCLEIGQRQLFFFLTTIKSFVFESSVRGPLSSIYVLLFCVFQFVSSEVNLPESIGVVVHDVSLYDARGIGDWLHLHRSQRKQVPEIACKRRSRSNP